MAKEMTAETPPETPTKKVVKKKVVKKAVAQPPETQKKRAGLTTEHLEALDKGRRAGRAVRSYLEYLERTRGPRRRGRQVNWSARLEAAQKALSAATDPLERLRLHQEVRTAESHLNVAQEDAHAAILEDGFVQWAKVYGDAHKINYATWRQIGVPAAVLKKAGITR